MKNDFKHPLREEVERHPSVAKVMELFPSASITAIKKKRSSAAIAKRAKFETKVLSIDCLAELNGFANRRELIPDARAWTVEQAEIIIAQRDTLRLGSCVNCDWRKCRGIGSIANPREAPFQTVALGEDFGGDTFIEDDEGASTVAEPPTPEMLERRRVSEAWQARLDELGRQYEAARRLRLIANAERLRDGANDKPQPIKPTNNGQE